MPYNGEVFKNVVKPYYKYKQSAYSSIRELAIRLLKEADFLSEILSHLKTFVLPLVIT